MMPGSFSRVGLIISVLVCCSARTFQESTAVTRRSSHEERSKIQTDATGGTLSLRGILFVRGGTSEPPEVLESMEETESWSEMSESEGDETEGDDGASETESDDLADSTADQAFVEPFVVSPTIQLYTTLGSIILSRRLDLSNPNVVRAVRFAYIAQIVLQQLFVLYVRIAASRRNDMTTVATDGPLSKMISTYMKGAEDTRGVVKNLASTFLNTETTVMEYDLKTASKLQGGVLLNMLFMWYLHFKLNKVQPILMQIVRGFIQLAFNPLFQDYCMGRNIKRPFPVPVSPATAETAMQSE